MPTLSRYSSHTAPHTLAPSSVICAVDKAPGLGQLKLIYHGNFLEDTKSLKDARVLEGELTTLHVVVKREKSKDSNGSGDDKTKTPKCTCVVC